MEHFFNHCTKASNHSMYVLRLLLAAPMLTTGSALFQHKDHKHHTAFGCFSFGIFGNNFCTTKCLINSKDISSYFIWKDVGHIKLVKPNRVLKNTSFGWKLDVPANKCNSMLARAWALQTDSFPIFEFPSLSGGLPRMLARWGHSWLPSPRCPTSWAPHLHQLPRSTGLDPLTLTPAHCTRTSPCLPPSWILAIAMRELVIYV